MLCKLIDNISQLSNVAIQNLHLVFCPIVDDRGCGERRRMTKAPKTFDALVENDYSKCPFLK